MAPPGRAQRGPGTIPDQRQHGRAVGGLRAETGLLDSGHQRRCLYKTPRPMMRVSTIRWIRYAALAALLTLPLTTGNAAESQRPNILFIFSDDHAYQAIGAYGDPRKLIETPNMDRIAREGMRFDRCIVP